MPTLDKQPLILVVDDEIDITETYALFLSMHGFEVMTANNALIALETISKRVPDLIISDCMMPFMDGVEFSRRVKGADSTARVPIILMSGAPELHDLASPTYEAFLPKPVLFQRLLREIERLLM
ncbi:MAG: response regulator [Pseudomonadota bacterium]